MAGSNFGIEVGEFTKFGEENYNELVSEAESVSFLKDLIAEKTLTKRRILGARQLSFFAVAKNGQAFGEILEKYLLLDVTQRVSCQEILSQLPRISKASSPLLSSPLLSSPLLSSPLLSSPLLSSPLLEILLEVGGG
jgi:hypothetical protein